MFKPFLQDGKCIDYIGSRERDVTLWRLRILVEIFGKVPLNEFKKIFYRLRCQTNLRSVFLVS